ncbi:MGDG synthase family glycosyltransferase [Cytobacillus praedii]|uniref:MGDG synthase family glycosyltransferase n=1 Tax=Cytobacillus praedii TaxID=1742358 RepID=UPI002E1F06C4|nr:UDP-glucuronosyltransferase [Cytobacillus praedii]
MEKRMKTVLFLPFLQIPSGHHQTANALIDGIRQIDPSIKCEVIDILSFSYGKIEKIISHIYLKWIHLFPRLYNSIYLNSVYNNREKNKRYRLYEWLFMSFMMNLIKAKKPDLIVCTHALPAYMLNRLKKRNTIQIPIINVYTDYFIHRFWGLERIDYHFVPSYQMKVYLTLRGISDRNIFITGIPIHSKIKKQLQLPEYKQKQVSSVLISGGNLGVGGIEELLEELSDVNSPQPIQFFVLCGKNKKLYKKLKGLQNHFMIPYPYISCRKKMNNLYDQIDAILTKPGGVTISESLFKRKPIFIYDALPGQEEINLKYLKEAGLVFHLNKGNICEQILSILQDKDGINRYQLQVANFHSQIYSKEPSEIITNILMD